MASHTNETIGSIHIIHNMEFASSALRLAYTYVTGDVDKIVKQTDDSTYYIVTSTAPTFIPLTINAITGDITVSSLSVATVGVEKSINTVSNKLSLVNDSVAPGNNKVYGTDGTGVKGWKADPTGSAGHVIQDNGSPMTARANLNFIGATVADDAGNDATKITITGGSSTHAIMVSLPGTAYVADNIVWVRLPYAMTLAKVRLGLQTKGTGTGATKAKVTYHATSPASAATVFTSETDAPACTSSDYTDDSGAPSTTALSAGGWIGIGFSAVCGTTAGGNAVIELLEA